MLNSFINSPMVCGLWGSARTYALITVFSLFFFLIRFPLTQSLGTILAIFDVPKDQNLFFESATLFCMCPLGVLMMDDDSWSQGFVRMSHVKCIYK